MAGGGRVKHPTLTGPSLVKEIGLGIVFGLMAGAMWKKNQWDNQKKRRMFYDMLENGEISIVAEE